MPVALASANVAPECQKIESTFLNHPKSDTTLHRGGGWAISVCHERIYSHFPDIKFAFLRVLFVKQLRNYNTWTESAWNTLLHFCNTVTCALLYSPLWGRYVCAYVCIIANWMSVMLWGDNYISRPPANSDVWNVTCKIEHSLLRFPRSMPPQFITHCFV